VPSANSTRPSRCCTPRFSPTTPRRWSAPSRDDPGARVEVHATAGVVGVEGRAQPRAGPLGHRGVEVGEQGVEAWTTAHPTAPTVNSTSTRPRSLPLHPGTARSANPSAPRTAASPTARSPSWSQAETPTRAASATTCPLSADDRPTTPCRHLTQDCPRGPAPAGGRTAGAFGHRGNVPIDQGDEAAAGELLQG